MNSVLGTLGVNITANTGSFHTGMSTVDKQLKVTENKMALVGAKASSIGKSMSSLGKNLAMKVTLPIVALGGLSVKAFSDFDKAMTESTSIMGDLSDTTVRKMKDLAMSLSTEGTASAKQLADSYYFLASAGLDAQQSMGALKTVMQFSIAGAFDMATATDLLTDAQTALGLSAKDPVQNMKNMTRVSDALTRAATLANSSVKGFAESLTNSAATAMKGLNVELETGLAMLSAYAAKGIKGNIAGNMLARNLRLTTSAAVKNSEAWKNLGVKVFDANGKTRNMIKVMSDLGKKMSIMSDEERIAQLELLGFEALAQKSITPLLDMGDAMSEYEKQLKSAGGTTADVANKQMKSFSARMKQLWNKINVVAIVIGEKLVPVIDSLVSPLGKVLDFIKTLDGVTLSWGIAIAGIVAALPLVLIVLGSLITAIGTIGTVLAGVTLAGIAWGAIIGGIIAGVAMLATWMLYFSSGAADATTWTERLGLMWAQLIEVGQSVWASISPIFNDLKSAIMDFVFIFQNQVWPILKPLMSGIIAYQIFALKTAFEVLIWPIEKVVKAIATLMGLIKELTSIGMQNEEIQKMEKRLKAMQDAKKVGIGADLRKDPNIANLDIGGMSKGALEALKVSSSLPKTSKAIATKSPVMKVAKIETPKVDVPTSAVKADSKLGMLSSGSLEAYQASIKAGDPQKQTNKELKESNKHLKKIKEAIAPSSSSGIITVDKL